MLKLLRTLENAVRRSKATTTSGDPDTRSAPESVSTGLVWRPRASQPVVAPYSVCINDRLVTDPCEPGEQWVPIEDCANLGTAREVMRRTQLLYPRLFVKVYDNSRGAFISDHPVFHNNK